jgi:hypothetical protein
MDLDQVIALLQADRGRIGATAMPGHPNYEACSGLQFQLCECSRRAGPGYDYIASGPRGGIWYVGINGVTRVISCGQKGYHALNGTPLCI